MNTQLTAPRPVTTLITGLGVVGLPTQVFTSVITVTSTPKDEGQIPQVITWSNQPIPSTTIPRSSETSSTSSETFSTAPSIAPSLNASSPNIGSGAIAGIAIGGVLLFALIVGGWYFWHRKKRGTQPGTATLTEDELVRREGDGDKIVLDQHQTAPTTGTYQTQYQEMSGNGLAQESDRSHSYKYAIGGAHELRAEDKPGELPYAGVDNGRDGVIEESTAIMGSNNTASQAAQVSPHVEAQRKREVEWLEAEETRMRQRREALLQQGGAKT